MQYALLVYEAASDLELRDVDNAEEPYFGAWRAYYQAMLEAGIYVGGQVLATPDSGTTVRGEHAKRQIQDGPYADTKEQLGGLIVLELSSLDAALEWAARCPAAMRGAVEVRPLAPDVMTRATGPSAIP